MELMLKYHLNGIVTEKKGEQMRFIHMADMHFDAPFTALSRQEELGDIRRLEQRKIFNKIIEYIKKENIEYLFIAGDLYEHQYIRESTIEYIHNLFKAIPKTKVFISPGNHDPMLKNSYYHNFEWSDNVYIFSSEIQKHDFEEVEIYGYGFEDFYCKNSKIEEIQIENPEKINIFITHGSLNASQTVEMGYNPINENKIKQIGFDYIALGHIHKQTINGNIVYPGSCLAFGFDELGKHGILDVTLEKNSLQINFIDLDEKEFVEKEVDISNIFSEEELIETLINIKTEPEKLYKIILTGNKNIEVNQNKIIKIINQKNILKIKDQTKLAFNLEKIEKENNLKSYFLKEIMNLKKENEVSEEEIKQALEIGLQILQN